MNDSGRGERNVIWEYFEKVDEENKEAECKLCRSVLNYRSTSHNLKNHLKHKHRDIAMSIPTPSPAPQTMKMRKNRSSVWEYFEIFDNEKKIASCNECQRTISYKTTTANLKTHLRRVHKQKYAEMEGLAEEEVYLDGEGGEYLCNCNPQIIDNEKIASCNECQRTISFKTTTANLKTYLRRVYTQKYAEMEGLAEECE